MVARGRELRLVAALLFGLTLGWAAPPLTTIQDTLYKADGTAFNGFLLIDWTSFQAPDASNIATHHVTVQVVNGILKASLVPNTTGSSYSVLYVSDGKVQFQETWVVPSSTAVVKLKAVRSSSGSSGGSTTPPPADTTVTIANVTGLQDALDRRPMVGGGFVRGRVAFLDSEGKIGAVTGPMGECVRVNGTTTMCASEMGSGPGFVDNETPSGLVNSSNVTFTLANPPSPASSLKVYRNGLLQTLYLDYTLAGSTVTFATSSTPQVGDVVTASYRLADSGNPVSAAGGALAGMYPNPTIADGVILDGNVSDLAGIRESKLLLNYPTHSNANDPTVDQKAAMAGTAGTASAANKYVTSQDSRLSDSRTPLGHALLGSGHSDAAAGTVTRGDLIVGQGSTPVWTRLPLGSANRCLTSNGTDAVWNTCLYTGFPAGAVPFIDASGSLTQNSARLVWDDANRKLSVGNAMSTATLYLWDSQTTTGVTKLAVRAGQGQGTNSLQQWLDASANEVARVDVDGRIAGASFKAATSATRAAWQESGYTADPATRSDGDAWYNTTALARKTAEGAQVHAVPQVLCSGTGSATSATAAATLGTCTIPAGFLKAGDRIDVRFDYSHEGTAAAFTFDVKWGSTTMLTRSGIATEAVITGRANAGVHASGAQWSVESWGTSTSMAVAVGAASDSLASAITLSFTGRLSATGSDTVTLRNFTVIRYPAQQNP